jgi:hypothetical protein
MQILEFLKDNKRKIFTVLGALLVIGLIIAVIFWFRKPGAYVCPQGQVKDTTCNTGQCRIQCPTNTPYYDCHSKTCGCDPSTGQELCGSGSDAGCCSAKNCFKHTDGTSTCCAFIQQCQDKCCPGGQVCLPGTNQCVTSCGIHSDGKLNICPSGYSCMTIENVLPSRIKDFDNLQPPAIIDQNSDGTYTVYVCKQMSTCEAITDKNITYAPSAIDNFYPCLNGTVTSKNNGIGFCYTSANDSDSISKCFENPQCSTPCTFINIFEELKNNSFESLDEKMKHMAGSTGRLGLGFWCNKGGGTSNRVVQIKLGETCTWQDCWEKLAQKGVIDVEFDDTTNMCTAIQDCTGNAETLNPDTPPSITGNVTLPSCDYNFPTGSFSDHPNIVIDKNTGTMSDQASTYGCTFTANGRECISSDQGTMTQSACQSMLYNTNPSPDQCPCGTGFEVYSGDGQCYRTMPTTTGKPPCVYSSGSCGTCWDRFKNNSDALYTTAGFEYDGCQGPSEPAHCKVEILDDMKSSIPLGRFWCDPGPSVPGGRAFGPGQWWHLCSDPQGCTNTANKSDSSSGSCTNCRWGIDGDATSFNNICTPSTPHKKP